MICTMERKCKSGLMGYWVVLENYSAHKRHTALVWNSQMEKLWHIQPTMNPLTHFALLNHSSGLPKMPMSGLQTVNTLKASTRAKGKMEGFLDMAGGTPTRKLSRKPPSWPRWKQLCFSTTTQDHRMKRLPRWGFTRKTLSM